MEDDRRDPNRPGRREEDERWLKVQEQIMNLVTAERTDQQELTAMKSEVAKLSDHIEDLDDYLRGVAGHDSLDNRVVFLERESTANTVLLRQIKKQIEDLKATIAGLQITSAIHRETEVTKRNLFTEWLKFWGPIAIATLGLVVPLTKMACDHAVSLQETQYRPDERLRRQIEADKKSRHAKEVQKKLHELERAQMINR